MGQLALHPVAGKIAQCEAAVHACRVESAAALAYVAQARAHIVQLAHAVERLERLRRQQEQTLRTFRQMAVTTFLAGIAVAVFLRLWG